MSSTLRATISQPRSLLSMAKLNIAKSRVRPPTWSLVRIDQTCFGRSGGFAPISLPLFQGLCSDTVGVEISWWCMVCSSIDEGHQHAAAPKLGQAEMLPICSLRIESPSE